MTTVRETPEKRQKGISSQLTQSKHVAHTVSSSLNTVENTGSQWKKPEAKLPGSSMNIQCLSPFVTPDLLNVLGNDLDVNTTGPKGHMFLLCDVRVCSPVFQFQVEEMVMLGPSHPFLRPIAVWRHSHQSIPPRNRNSQHKVPHKNNQLSPVSFRQSARKGKNLLL